LQSSLLTFPNGLTDEETMVKGNIRMGYAVKRVAEV
jgi:hypothetical protein